MTIKYPMRWKELTESVFYQGEFKSPYGAIPVDLKVLHNPTPGEMRRMFATAQHDPYTAGGKELRGLLSDDLYVWESRLAAHDDVKKVFGLTGMHVFFYPGEMKMDDYLLRDPDMKAEAVQTVEQSAAIQRALGPVRGQMGPNGFGFFSA